MSLSIYNLEIFKAISESESVSAASEKLYVSQSAVSHQLRLLEEHFGLRLFERQGRKMVLTKAGKMVQQYVNDILEKYKEMQISVQDLQKANKGHIVIAGSLIPGTYLLPPIVGRFKEEHPSINLQLKVYTTTDMLKDFFDSALDFGILTSKQETDYLVHEKIRTEEVIIIASPNGSEKHMPVSKEDLETKPFICSIKGSQGRINADNILAAHGIYRSNIVMEVGHPEAVKQAVRAGLGLGLIHRFCVEKELMLGILKEVPIEGLKMYGDIYLVHRPYKQFLPIEEMLIEFIKKESFHIHPTD